MADDKYESDPTPAAHAQAVPKWATQSLGRCMLELAKSLCGDHPDTFRDPALQQEYELFKSDREEWKRRYAS